MIKNVHFLATAPIIVSNINFILSRREKGSEILLKVPILFDVVSSFWPNLGRFGPVSPPFVFVRVGSCLFESVPVFCSV